MSLERPDGPWEAVDDAVIAIPAAELDTTAPHEAPLRLPDQLGPVTVWGLLLRAWRGRVVGPVLTRVAGYAGSWAAWEARQEYLRRLELERYRHHKELLAERRKTREFQAQAEALLLERDLLLGVHARATAIITADTIAHTARGEAITQQGRE